MLSTDPNPPAMLTPPSKAMTSASNSNPIARLDKPALYSEVSSIPVMPASSALRMYNDVRWLVHLDAGQPGCLRVGADQVDAPRASPSSRR